MARRADLDDVLLHVQPTHPNRDNVMSYQVPARQAEVAEINLLYNEVLVEVLSSPRYLNRRQSRQYPIQVVYKLLVPRYTLIDVRIPSRSHPPLLLLELRKDRFLPIPKLVLAHFLKTYFFHFGASLVFTSR